MTKSSNSVIVSDASLPDQVTALRLSPPSYIGSYSAITCHRRPRGPDRPIVRQRPPAPTQRSTARAAVLSLRVRATSCAPHSPPSGVGAHFPLRRPVWSMSDCVAPPPAAAAAGGRVFPIIDQATDGNWHPDRDSELRRPLWGDRDKQRACVMARRLGRLLGRGFCGKCYLRTGVGILGL